MLLLRLASLAAAIPMLAVPAQAGQAPAAAQPAGAANVCGTPVAAPPANQLPPAGSGPYLWLLGPCFDAQANVSLIDVQTYMYYIQLQQRSSRPSQGIWTPYNDDIEDVVQDDFHRLWNTNFLDNLWIDVKDYTFSNGVVGKIVVYHMEERQRGKVVELTGSKKLETSKITEQLRTQNAEIRVDTFVDPGLLRKVEGILREMLKEKGFQNAEATHEIKEVSGGPKLINVTFLMSEGPKVKIRRLDFVGNQAASDGDLTKRIKNNKSQWMFSWVTGRGTYQAAKFEEDATA